VYLAREVLKENPELEVPLKVEYLKDRIQNLLLQQAVLTIIHYLLQEVGMMEFLVVRL
jgi:hypothetical protein